MKIKIILALCMVQSVIQSAEQGRVELYTTMYKYFFDKNKRGWHR